MLSLPGWGSVIFIISYDTLKKFPVCFQGRPDKQTNKTSQGRSTPPHLWPGADHKEILTCHCPKVYHNEPLHSEGVLGCLYSKECQQEERWSWASEQSISSYAYSVISPDKRTTKIRRTELGDFLGSWTRGASCTTKSTQRGQGSLTSSLVPYLMNLYL